MSLSKDDRIAFSSQIVEATAQIKGLQLTQLQLSSQISKLQKLDTANKNLFDRVNLLTNVYQQEMTYLDGIVRTTIAEQNVIDSANKKFQNCFFPNDINTAVPSLTSLFNIWPRFNPFALTFSIGKNYIETNSVITKEGDLINSVLSYITSATLNTDMQNTTGQHCVATGTCSLPLYTDQATCLLNGGVWTPGPDSIQSFPTVQTLRTDTVAAVNSLKSFLLTEVSNIVANDPNTSRQADNDAAINNINNVIIPALNTWLAYVDFNTSHGQTNCPGFNGYNSNLLAPTKLHSVQLAALQSALNTRTSFISTRVGQLSTVLGTITQDIDTGYITASSGLYGQRHSYLTLRLNILNGSLSQLTNYQNSIATQDSVINSIQSTAATYGSFLPTSAFKTAANGTTMIHIISPQLFSAGDSVYIMADNQEELQRAIKSISNDMVTLNDTVPSKYTVSANLRIYKDLS